MSENTPIKTIPLPNYKSYQTDLCNRYSLTLPLKIIPFGLNGNLALIPPPIQSGKKGWPWTIESDVKFSDTDVLPKVSVVIPSYRQGQYIEEAIRSVILQNYPNMELIIMDGGSDDETANVLEYYKDFVSVAVSEKDRGQSHAINKGFSLATGSLYYWLNSDDYLNLNSLNNIIPHFLNDDKLDIVYGHGLAVDKDSHPISFDYAPLVLNRYLRFGGILLSHSVIWREHAHCPVWEDLNCAMDAELWLRLFAHRKSRHSQFPIGIYRKHPQQKTSVSQVWAKQWKEDYEIYIWKAYSSISKAAWEYRMFEFKIVQKIYRKLHPFKHQNDR